MTLTLALDPNDEAKLLEAARERGMSADELVQEAIEKVLAEALAPSTPREPSRSLRGLWAKYGEAPSAEEMAENRREMIAGFPRSDF